MSHFKKEKPTEAKKAKKDENGTAPEAEDAADEEADDEEIEGEDEEYGDEGGKNFSKNPTFPKFHTFSWKIPDLTKIEIYCSIADIPYGEEDDLEGEDDDEDLEGGE